MKPQSLIASLLVSLLLISTCPVIAQTAAVPAAAPLPVQPSPKVVVLHITSRDYFVYRANFDTDGQKVGGLTESELEDKFYKFTSIARLLNFVTQQGYEMVSLVSTGASSVSAATHNGAGFSDYTVVFKHVAP